MKQSDLIKLSKIICWVCLKDLDFKLALSLLQIKIIKNRAEIKETTLDSVQCSICFSFYRREFFRELSCGDIFCMFCIFCYISLKIDEKDVKSNQVICPQCSATIEPKFVLNNFPRDKFEKLNEYLADHFEPSDNNCRISRCKNCQVLVEAGIKIENLICTLCKKNFCQYCYESHLEGRCKFRHGQTVRDMNDKRCPNCFSQVFKGLGCNFVTCPRAECRRFNFCYLCLKPLTEKEHYRHFPEGTYVDTCETLESMKENINKNNK
jgi:hypothetical protein